MSITNRNERTDETPCLNNTSESQSCQEKTLVSNNAIFENMNHFRVYDHCVVFKKRFKNPSTTPKEPKKRGKINHFSKRARFRLFALLAKIRQDLDYVPLFITLTYHYGHENDPHSTKSQLHNFLVQLRQYDPNVQFIWRCELQKRGAPHYHMIIFPSFSENNGNINDYFAKIRFIWHSIADPKSRKHAEYGCKIVSVRSYKEACAYLSKYIAKCSNEEKELEEGKHWGNSRNLPIKMRVRIGSFDDDSKQLINKLLKWLRDNGKGKYANDEFINIHNDFVVFISQKDFLQLLDGEDYFCRDY